jgi:hypothetical protein
VIGVERSALVRLLGASLTIPETVGIFVLIPLAVILAVFGAVYGGSSARSKRYRPGRPFTSAPVWYLAEEAPGSTPARALAGASSESVHHGEVGGASDSW